MKYILALSLASLLFFFGCDQGSDITSPISDSTKMESGPLGADDPDGIEQYLYPKIDFDLYPPGADTIFTSLGIPDSEIPNLAVSKLIDGNDGGRIDFNYEYQIGEGNTITITAWLIFPLNAFDGEKEISIQFNHEITAVSFHPHMDFNRTVEFEVEYTGIDLSGIDPNSIDFLFQNHDGSTEQINYDYITVNASTGRIFLDDGELTHFSRYGFVNRQF